MTCHTEAKDEAPTCPACGEASWSVSMKLSAKKPAPTPAASPKPAFELDESDKVTETVDAIKSFPSRKRGGR